MKICFLMPWHWTKALGGAELQVKYIVEHLKRNTGHEVVVVCRDSEVRQENGVRVYRASTVWPFGRYSHASCYLSVRRLLWELAPDVVYTRSKTPFVGFAAGYCKKYHKKLIFHIAGMGDVRPSKAIGRLGSLIKIIEQPIYEYGLRNADVIIAQAEYQVKMLQEQYGLLASAVIRNFHPIPPIAIKEASPKKVLWVANLKPIKRPELFVKLAMHCTDLGDTQFVMIGAIQNQRYRGLLTEASKLSNFKYLGKQTVEEVQRELGSAHLFVNTSVSEGFPNTFIQSWLNRVPVVSLEVNPDGLLNNDGLGASCKGSVGELERKTREFLSDTERLESMGAGGREFAVRHYGEDNCQRLVSLIESLSPH